MRMRKVNIYVQHSREQMAEFYNEPRNWFLNSNVDLATQRDVVERLHLAGAEPEGVTYAEVDANSVLSLWCTGEMPQGPRAVAHARRGFRRLVDTHGSKGCWAHRKDGRSSSPAGRLPACAQHKYPAQSRTSRKAIASSSNKGFVPKTSLASVTPLAETLP